MPRIKQLQQLIRFGISGVAGFLVDAGIVALCTQTVGMKPIPSQAVAFSVAVTVTWLINRHWTFAEHANEKWLYEWTRYVAANSVGAVVNNGVYGILVLTLTLFSSNPVLAVAAGSLSGMSFNFILSRLFVFGSSPT
ncbi:GtrA family protein [Acidithiobacillus caldus]|jgi:putative flippase GtrA|uniref:GtrA family protein n=1 Tax=Acidithiobacillus caldus TaxID=33059 RepID=UPI001301708B|nr:GtrA family protein [Acidithiobacillus caldus]